MQRSRVRKNFYCLVVCLLIFSLLLTTLPPVGEAAVTAVTVITPVAMPGAGTYDRAQDVILYSYDSANPVQTVKITYKYQGREAIPETDYYAPGITRDTDITQLPKITIDSDGILSVSAYNSSDASNKKYTQFRYVINASVLSVYPGYYTDSVSGAVYSRVYIKFSRKMNLDKMSYLNFEVRQGNETAQLEKKDALGKDVANNQVYIDLLKRLDGDQDYKLTIVPTVKGALPDGSNAEVRDSDGKLFAGQLQYTFHTLKDAPYTFYGSVWTELGHYATGNPASIKVKGTYLEKVGEEWKAQISDDKNIKIQFFKIEKNNSYVLKGEGTIDSVGVDGFEGDITGIDLSAGGDYVVKAYAGSGSSYELFAENTFTVGTLNSPQLKNTPDVSPSGGVYKYFEPVKVTLSTNQSGVEIYYTLVDKADYPDGLSPKVGNKYTGPLSIDPKTLGGGDNPTYILRAIARKGNVFSDEVKAVYAFNTALGYLQYGPSGSNVAINEKPYIKFGRAVKPDVANKFFLKKILDGKKFEYVSGRVRYDSLEHKAVFYPDAPLQPDTRYQGYVLKTVQDLEGNNFNPGSDMDSDSSGFYWEFKTGAGQGILVDGSALVGNSTAVNKNPVRIDITLANINMVTINKTPALPAESNSDDETQKHYYAEVPLKAGRNSIEVITTATDGSTETYKFTIVFADVLADGAERQAVLDEKGKIELFGKKLSLQFAPGTHLYDTNSELGASVDQTIKVEAYKQQMVKGSPAVGYVFDIYAKADAQKTGNVDLNNKAEATITVPYDKQVSQVSKSALSVVFRPDSYSDWQVLGGVVDTGKGSVKVPFKGFGEYVVVNRIPVFPDFEQVGWAKMYVEYLWARGIMNEDPARQPFFGLLETDGTETPITRGEFTVMLGRALGYNPEQISKSELRTVKLFSDLRIESGAAQARDLQTGRWYDIPLDEYKYIYLAARNGVATGVLTPTYEHAFDYYSYISREQVATMLCRAMNLKVDDDDTRVAATMKKLFTDTDSANMSQWAMPYILATVKAGYLAGFPDRTFGGKQYFTRPQAAKTIYMMMKKAKLIK